MLLWFAAPVPPYALTALTRTRAVCYSDDMNIGDIFNYIGGIIVMIGFLWWCGYMLYDIFGGNEK